MEEVVESTSIDDSSTRRPASRDHASNLRRWKIIRWSRPGHAEIEMGAL